MSNPLAQIHMLYVEQTKGEPRFSQRLMAAVEQIGRFRLTNEREHADAVVQAQGQDADDGFVGELVISDPRGTVLWSAWALRLHGEAGPMAYERLIDQLRQELAS
jgi:hypothetical protein